MAAELVTPRTRRALLGATVGALAASVAQALGRPRPARAGVDGDVVLGASQYTGAQTTIINLSTTSTVLQLTNFGGGTGLGVSTSSGRGIDAWSAGSTAIRGEGLRGVVGVSATGDGVVGASDGSVKSGVYGENTVAAGYGVFGRNTATGATGYLGGAFGVSGYVTEAGSIAVYAEAGSAAATALRVVGVSRFSRSGKLTIPANATSATKTGVALSSSSLVLAVLQQNRAGVFVRAAVPNVAGGSFTVYLNKVASTTAGTTVAWFIVN